MVNEDIWYKLTFKQIQPIHIGDNKHGVINETKIFIPGQTMWGALTNAYFQKTNNYNKNLFENVSCFYSQIKNKDNVLTPQYKNGEFYLDELSEIEFRQKFTTTLLSTAINPTTLNAQDKSFHEIDVILPKDDIKWVGYLKVNEDIINELLKIKSFYIGGDSRYGLGLVELINTKEENYNQEPIKGKINKYTPNEPFLTNFLEFNNQKFEGKLELLAEFDFTQNTPKIIEAKYYITPGSIIYS